MKFLTINICPPDKCAQKTTETLKRLSFEERKQRIICLIRAKKPDVIYFIEEWYPVYSRVKAVIESEYEFFCPDGFDPSCKNSEGEYVSYSGIVAAVKSDITVNHTGGKKYVGKDGKWLSLEIDGYKYLGVHYPQPTNLEEYKGFHEGVAKFVEQEKPVALIGDFNPPEGVCCIINGYKDLLPINKPTSAFDTKLDYIFLVETNRGAKAELIKSAMEGESIFSDHFATMLTL